jgi:hypothetical protein
VCGVLAVAGCVGPAALRGTRLRYNEAYRKTTDEEILLNIVRLRYGDSPVFIDLPNITSQFQVSATGSGTGGVDGQGPGPTRLGFGELFLKDAPTLSYTPRSGQQVGKRLMAPLTAELLRSISPGRNTELFLLMAVDGMNDARNAPLATSFDPGVSDDNAAYRHAVRLFVGLQERGDVELRVATFDADRYERLPLSQVRGRDLLEASKDGKVFRPEGESALLLKREKSLVLVIRPGAMDSYEAAELIRLLGLSPARGLYRVVSQENDEIDPDERPSPLGEDTIHLDMRSLLQIMTFLSKGVHVPAQHLDRGIAPTTRGPDGAPFDWTLVTGGFFRVCVQKHRPKHAEIAVPYRDHWYFVAEDDVPSRTVLSLLELILELQETESERAGPLLTLPVG